MIDPIKTIYIQVPKKTLLQCFENMIEGEVLGETLPVDADPWPRTPLTPGPSTGTPTDAVSFEAPLDGWPAVRGGGSLDPLASGSFK